MAGFALKLFRQFAPQLAVAIMYSWACLRVRESDGANRGPVVDAIHELAGGDDEDAAPWCARAVVAAWVAAGWACGSQLAPEVSRSGSVFYMLHETHRKAPHLVTLSEDITDPRRQVRPGDAMIRYEVRDKYADVPVWDRQRAMTTRTHVEIVLRVHADGRLDTIGGNTDSDKSRDGDGVYIHMGRYAIGDHDVVGFVRPKWVALPEPP